MYKPLPMDIDGKTQVTAAISLIKFSQLLRWNPDSAQFDRMPKEQFDSSWSAIDPVFGRLICWINFSAGAEFLAKGVCLLNGIDIRTTIKVPDYPKPSTDLPTWARQFRKDPTYAGTVETTKFGTLGDLYNDRPTKHNPAPNPALKRLCFSVKAADDQRELLLAAYELLAKTIRNRDAHAYVHNVRGSHFYLAYDLFAKCFNLLLSWLPDYPEKLKGWMTETP